MEISKKKILYLSDFSKSKTGFGRNSKAVLSYLHSTGKYEIVEYACSPYSFNDPRLKSLPWKAYGAMPEDEWILHEMSKNEGLDAMVKYGSFFIDDLIQKEKPDFFIGVQDFWAFTDFYDKKWWNKIHCALWITIDSLPIYPEALENASKIKNFWVWSKFAENEFKKLGHDHIKTIPGAFDVSCFRPLENKKDLRSANNIEESCKIFGFVFRNQPRKLIGTLIDAFSLLKKNEAKAKLLIHTSWNDSGKPCWDIPSFIKEFGVNNEDILTTYVCAACGEYEVRPFSKDVCNCNKCKNRECSTTVKPNIGVSEEKMNEIYNMMDFYIHPVTSGGLEMPIVESLLAGIPVATCNYSCGEEFCEQSFVTTINHTIFREPFSQFKKAQPDPIHICEIMQNVIDEKYDLQTLSKNGRSWAESRFDVKNICSRIEEWIDSSPKTNYSFSSDENDYDENYPFKDFGNDEEWAADLISNIFKIENDKEVIEKIKLKLSSGADRKTIHERSIVNAKMHNQKVKKNLLSTYLPDNLTGLTCFISPNLIEEKLICLDFLRSLTSSEKIVIVCDEIDSEIFGDLKQFFFVPKSEKTNSPYWMKSLKNSNGDKIFKKVIYKNGNSFESTH